MKLVQELITIDKQARDAYQQLEDERAHFDEFIATQRQLMLAEYTAQVEQEIADTKAEIAKRVSEKTAQAQTDFESSWEQIKKEFETHHAEWLQAIVKDSTSK